MDCFNHRSTAAVGTCKACGKGICHECAVDLGHGLSCKGEHEATVQSYHDMLNRNARALAVAPRNIAIAPAFYVFLGAVFVIYGLTSPQGIRGVTFVMGCGFLVFGVVVYTQARKAIVGKRESLDSKP